MNYIDFVFEARKTPLNETTHFPADLVFSTDTFLWKMTVRTLESEGFSVSAKTVNFPEGVYVAEGVSDMGTLFGWNLETEIPTEILVKNIGWPFLSRKPLAPRMDIQGLKLVPHHTMAALFCREGKWQTPIFVPSGTLSVPIADTTGIQYGQSAFEGACAMRNAHGDVFGYRLDQNAERFNKSIQSLDLPEINFLEIERVIQKIIQYNYRYVPQDGKLYIRPSVSGLSGGLGVIVPEVSVITVEVAAFGNYLPPSIRIEGIKNIARPQTGATKIAPNYGASFKIKHGVKSRGYADYLSFDARGAAEEVATCAVGFIDKTGNFVFPPVSDEVDTRERHILPSITRKSTIEILKKSEESVVLRDVFFDEISQMEGIFTMGNAVGVLHVSEICLKENETDPGHIIKFSNPKTAEKIAKIREKVYAARTGDLPGFESWAKKIGGDNEQCVMNNE